MMKMCRVFFLVGILALIACSSVVLADVDEMMMGDMGDINMNMNMMDNPSSLSLSSSSSSSPSSSSPSSPTEQQQQSQQQQPQPVLAEVSQQLTVEGPTGRRPTLPPHKQPKDKLDVALAAIKQDIMVRNRQLEEEKNWVGEVRKIIEQYNKKVHRVEADIVKTRSEVKELFKKKKQVENLKIQRALESKLKDATGDLATLQQALHHVKSKSIEFQKTKDSIKKTIYSIHTQLAKLKGEKPVVKAPTDL